MHNFQNLNDIEFEALCLDFMSRKLGNTIRRYASGRDRGIDLNDDHGNIVQVKHYTRSTFSQLLHSLKKEVAKVEKINPKQYYLCCSSILTKENIEEIHNLFSLYMSSTENIFTGIEISDFLDIETNSDILQKHYKLWLCASSVLQNILSSEVDLDSDYCFNKAEFDIKLFVETEAYTKSLSILEKNNALFITGAPGIGKTITSRMLALFYKVKGYQLTYTTSITDLGTIKRRIRSSPSKKEIILLDDCLGRIYFEMKSSQEKELLSLIEYIKNNKNKKVILNSRVTVFNHAKSRDIDLASFFDNGNCKIYVIDMNQINDFEKAKIFYNHLYFSCIPSKFYNSLLENNGYLYIITHKNYNPRIMEYVTRKARYDEIMPESYLSYILTQLNSPHLVWDDEYANRLQIVDRLLLQIIHSLTDTTVPFAYVQKCYAETLKNVSCIDFTSSNFNNSLTRLEKSFIIIKDDRNIKSISMINPSVNDYLNWRMDQEISEREYQIKNICSIDQIARLDEDNLLTHIEDLFKSGNILNYIFNDEIQKRHAIVYYVGFFGIKDRRYINYIQSHFEDCVLLEPFINGTISEDEQEILLDFFTTDLFDYYELREIVYTSDVITNILVCFDVFEMYKIINKIDASTDRHFTESITEAIKQSLDYYFENEYTYEGGYCGECDYESDYGYETEMNEAIEYMRAQVIEDATKVHESIFNNLNSTNLRRDDYDYLEKIDFSWIEDEIQSYHNSDPDYRNSPRSDMRNTSAYTKEINELFTGSTLKI